MDGQSCTQLWNTFTWEPEFEQRINARMATYTKDDWQNMKTEAEGVIKLFLDAYNANLPVDSEEAIFAAKEQRDHISKWFDYVDMEHYKWIVTAAKIKGEIYGEKSFFNKYANGLNVYMYESVISYYNKYSS